MKFIPRLLKQVKSSNDGGLNTTPPSLETLEKLRSVPAWVLLGEPGAGKTEAFKEEAKAINGLYLTIAEFICSEVEDDWREKCLFLDGLDEVRTQDNQSLLIKVKSQLKKLDLPNFRIACRAADWFGQSDRENIIQASPDQQLPVYVLEALSLEDIKNILKAHFNYADAESEDFIQQAQSHGISELLCNPQILKMIVAALKGKNWPNSRSEVYKLACENSVEEENRKHRDKTRFQSLTKEQLLDSAGRIFATLLLSDKSGVSLDKSVKDPRFPEFKDLDLESLDLVRDALATALFVPSTSNEERLEPTHRSVAEYLAAQWLGKKIDEKKLSLRRLSELMLGFDGKVVSSLRGLYGWLALKSIAAQQYLIKSDALTVLLYSDLQAMSKTAKQQLLQEMRLQIHSNPWILRDLGHPENLAHLFDLEFQDKYLSALQDTKRDEPTQAYAMFILDVLTQKALQGDLQFELKTTLRAIAADASRWEGVRRRALALWLKFCANSEAIEFLEQLKQGNIKDPDGELIRILLSELFPKVLSISQVLVYLHNPQSNTWGSYHYFWAHQFPEWVQENDLIFALDQLALCSDLRPLNLAPSVFSRMITGLLIRGVQIYGDHISDEKLFTWLRIGTDEYGGRPHDPDFIKAITQWLNDRPQRYKGLLGVCFARNDVPNEVKSSPLISLFNDEQVLQGVLPPADIGLWHFEQIDRTQNELLAQKHLQQAMRSLWSDRSTSGLTFEKILAWVAEDPIKKSWLEPCLICEIPDWSKHENPRVREYDLRRSEIKKDRSLKLAAKIEGIRAGVAHPALMYELASVWLNRYEGTRGDTPFDRFKNYCDNDVDVYQATELGLLACVKREDLPSIQEIIDLHVQQQFHWIRPACLLGMELVWEKTPEKLDLLGSSILEKMICFHLTNQTATSLSGLWFLHLVKNRPEIVAKVLITYANACFKAHKEYIFGIDLLETNFEYAQLARLCVPTLLRSFPTRNKSHQFKPLNSLLRAALKYEMPELQIIIADKLKRKSLNPGQRVYFLLAGVLLGIDQYEQALWDFVGQSWQLIQHISNFLCKGIIDSSNIDLSNLSAKTLAKLLEVLLPFADFDWPREATIINPEQYQALSLGRQVKNLINRLTALGTQESLHEIKRLIALPALQKIHSDLLYSQDVVIQTLRENKFNYFDLSNVTKILHNKEPANVADLQLIVLDCLDQIAEEIRTSNSDLFRQFWTEDKKNNQPKNENSCRDALLAMLIKYLEPLGIKRSEPEADHVGDKRVDIRVSYQKYEVPIEIKGEWHPELWTAMQTQLPQYTKKTDGFAIYCVLWFGRKKQAAVKDGGKKPVSHDELQSRLQKYLPKALQNRIAVKVLDLTYPK